MLASLTPRPTWAFPRPLTAVYDQAQDPHQVYTQMIAPLGWSEKIWLHQMYSYRTKAKRDELAKQLAWKPEEYTKNLTDPNSIKYRAEGLKIPDAVDQRIAATDPTFRAYLNELNSHTTHPDPSNPDGKAVSGMPMAHMQYLEQARAAWWTAENAKVQVNLTGTALSLSSQCTR